MLQPLSGQTPSVLRLQIPVTHPQQPIVNPVDLPHRTIQREPIELQQIKISKVIELTQLSLHTIARHSQLKNNKEASSPKCDNKEWQQKNTTKYHRDTHETYTIDKHNLPWQQPHKPPNQTTQPMTTKRNTPRPFLQQQITITQSTKTTEDNMEKKDAMWES